VNINLPSLRNINCRGLRIVYSGKPLKLTGRKKQMTGEDLENSKA
jgi:hypothetical protein